MAARIRVGRFSRPVRYIRGVNAAAGGWENWSWDESLFAGAAGYYEQGRLPYAPGLADVFARSLALDGRGRLLDVGCGPMVLEGNELGQALWQASGYMPQAEWRRWIKPVAGQPAGFRKLPALLPRLRVDDGGDQAGADVVDVAGDSDIGWDLACP